MDNFIKVNNKIYTKNVKKPKSGEEFLIPPHLKIKYYEKI